MGNVVNHLAKRSSGRLQIVSDLEVWGGRFEWSAPCDADVKGGQRVPQVQDFNIVLRETSAQQTAAVQHQIPLPDTALEIQPKEDIS